MKCWNDNQNDMSWYKSMVLSVPTALSSFRTGDNHRSNVSSNPSNLARSNPGSNPDSSQTPRQKYKKRLPKPCEIPRKMTVVCVVSTRPNKFQIIDISWYFLAYLPVIAKLPTFSSTGGGGSLVRASHEDIFPDFQQKKALGNLHRTSCTLARRPSSLRRIATSVSATEQQFSFRSSTHLFCQSTTESNELFFGFFFGHWGTTLVHASSLLSASLTRKLQANDHIWHWPYWTYLRSQLETSSRIWTRPYKEKKKPARIRNLWIRDLNETCKSESSNVSNSAKLRCVMMDWSNQALSKQKQSYAAITSKVMTL